jgi:MscS family membrane protein
MHKHVFLILALTAHAIAPSIAAQEQTSTPADVRATPRGSALNFLETARTGDYRSAASFLNLRGVRQTRAGEIARELQEVLDRALTTDPGSLSSAPEGDLTDGLSPRLELVGTVALGEREVEILLERVSSQGQDLWLFSSGTVALVPQLHASLGKTWIEQRLPEWMVTQAPSRLAVYQWLGLLILAVIAYLAGRLIGRLLMRALRPIIRQRSPEFAAQVTSRARGPFTLFVALTIFAASLSLLALPVLLRVVLTRILAALAFFAFAWLAVRLTDIIAAEVVIALGRRQRASVVSIVPLVTRTVKVAAMAIAVLLTLHSWGIDTTALLAGLGVGGLAVALAAQKTLENLFGGIALTTDRPVMVGDFCRWGDKIGTVEDIGLRSTRIRTLDRTIVTIPNAEFSNLQIENFAVRDKLWFHPVLNLRRETTLDQMRFLIKELREVLLRHPKIDPDPARVRFTGIGSSSLDIEIFAYITTTDMSEFLLVSEELLLGIMAVIEQAGTGLALPSQVTLLRRDPNEGE